MDVSPLSSGQQSIESCDLDLSLLEPGTCSKHHLPETIYTSLTPWENASIFPVIGGLVCTVCAKGQTFFYQPSKLLEIWANNRRDLRSFEFARCIHKLGIYITQLRVECLSIQRLFESDCKELYAYAGPALAPKLQSALKSEWSAFEEHVERRIRLLQEVQAALALLLGDLEVHRMLANNFVTRLRSAVACALRALRAFERLEPWYPNVDEVANLPRGKMLEALELGQLRVFHSRAITLNRKYLWTAVPLYRMAGYLDGHPSPQSSYTALPPIPLLAWLSPKASTMAIPLHSALVGLGMCNDGVIEYDVCVARMASASHRLVAALPGGLKAEAFAKLGDASALAVGALSICMLGNYALVYSTEDTVLKLWKGVPSAHPDVTEWTCVGTRYQLCADAQILYICAVAALPCSNAFLIAYATNKKGLTMIRFSLCDPSAWEQGRAARDFDLAVAYDGINLSAMSLACSTARMPDIGPTETGLLICNSISNTVHFVPIFQHSQKHVMFGSRFRSPKRAWLLRPRLCCSIRHDSLLLVVDARPYKIHVFAYPTSSEARDGRYLGYITIPIATPTHLIYVRSKFELFVFDSTSGEFCIVDLR